MDKKIAHLMKTLDITKEDALQLIEDDKKIDKGEKLFELTAEQKKASKQARQTAGDKTIRKKSAPKEQKPDNQKRLIIQALTKTLEQLQNVSKVEITNQQREVNFCLEDRKFKLVLSAPRK